MAGVKTILNKFKQLKTESALISAVSSTTEKIEELNRIQLLHGLIKTGEKLGEYKNGIFGYKNKYYAYIKYEMNPLPDLGNPDLFDTGAFNRGITAKVSGRKLKIFSTDEKSEMLEDKYPYIFGLGPLAKGVYIKENLRPNFIKQIKMQLNNG